MAMEMTAAFFFVETWFRCNNSLLRVVMQDSFGILHVNGTLSAIYAPNHVIWCHSAVTPQNTCKLRIATCMKKSKIDFLHRNQTWFFCNGTGFGFIR